jgi:hypothetical protein
MAVMLVRDISFSFFEQQVRCADYRRCHAPRPQFG